MDVCRFEAIYQHRKGLTAEKCYDTRGGGLVLEKSDEPSPPPFPPGPDAVQQ